MFFKSHHLPRPEYRRVVYLLRDGRDVMVSYWHQLKALERREVDFAAMIAGEGLFPCKWREHVEAWMANPHGAEVLIVRYGDMKADAVKELVRLCHFVRERREADELAQVAAKCSFAAMQRREERLGWDNPEWPTDKPFVRRGETGSYRDEMPADSLAAFMAEAGATLRKNGFTS
jgi:hypothetical protein